MPKNQFFGRRLRTCRTQGLADGFEGRLIAHRLNVGPGVPLGRQRQIVRRIVGASGGQAGQPLLHQPVLLQEQHGRLRALEGGTARHQVEQNLVVFAA